MSRKNIGLTGLLGLLGALVITGGAIYVMAAGLISPLLSRPLWVWSLFLFLLTFSLLEIPVMIFGLRQMAASANPTARYVVLLTTTAYTLFASIYALPFILLTGQLLAGAGLAALSIVRFITTMVMLPND